MSPFIDMYGWVIIITVALVSIIVYFIMQSRVKLITQQLKMTSERIVMLQEELHQERFLLDDLRQRIMETEIKKNDAEGQLKNIREKYELLLSDSDLQMQKFENIANRILKQQTANMDEKQKAGLKEILEPLKERIKTFEEKIEKSDTATIERHESLKQQIKFLYEKSDSVSREANNLVKALKGDYKKQGNWGELILESILDKSGLEKNREYYVQVTERDESGKMLKPDIVIHLPDGKRLVIDSKVSLNAYETMVNSDDEKEQRSAQKAHTLAVKGHIDNLSSKNYQDLYKSESLSFVLMFIPIDTALSAAIQYDPEMYNYAFDKNIVMVAPSTLLATLKTVDTMWRNDKQNRNALQIAEEAGKMYDKFVGFVEDMDKLGKQLHTVQNTYHDSMKKLSTGTGNLLSKAESVKSLGAKANKSLPKGDGD